MIFVIGGRGLVGSGFVRLLEARGDEFQIIDRANYDSCAARSANCW